MRQHTLTLLLVMLWSTNAWAQDAPARVPAPTPAKVTEAAPRPLAMTISGGVSLGGYQAGFLYYLSEMLKRNPRVAKLKAISGASAGSINSFITLMSMCSGEPEDYPESMFWKTWGDIGLDRLFAPNKTEPAGALARDAFAETIGRLRERWDAGLPEQCDVLFGVTATRLQPYAVQVQGDLLTLPRSEEEFIVHIKGQGPGRPPLVRNYVTPRAGMEQAMLPLDGPGADPFTSIKDLLFASSAFPLAFPPQQLTHCMLAPTGDAVGDLPRCTLDSARTADFIDGGVFDNEPLSLITRSARRGLEQGADGAWRWRPSPDMNRTTLPDAMILFAMNPSIKAWPRIEAQGEAVQPRDALSAMLAHFTTMFINAARSKELQELLVAYPELRERLALSSNHLPQASEPMGAFFGFFDRGLREYDFHIGMVDAHKFVRARAATMLAGRDLDTVFSTPEPHWSRDDPKLPPEAWRPFYCILGHLERDDALTRACAGKAMRNTRALLQVSFERLYDACRQLEPGQVKVFDSHCAFAADGAEPPRVTSTRDDPEWRRGDDESELMHVFRRLTATRYAYRDLGLNHAEADRAPRVIRNRLLAIGQRVAEVNASDQTLIQTLVYAGVNAIAYAPPQDIAYVTVGNSPEVGLSFLMSDSDLEWVRAHMALSAEGLTDLLTADDGAFALAPTAGLVFEPIPLNRATYQLRFGLRGGFLLSTEDRFFSDPCERANTRDALTGCSRLLAQSFVSLSLFERIRFQLTNTWTPPFRTNERAFWSVTPGLGFQLYDLF